ncbi:MAG: leucine-rich repeat domain-containing protein [Bacteroidales bacterium]|nr:leucine-rich repeat domain-containing protein [Bacteroidales bacterium]
MKRTLLLICTLLCANVLWAENEDLNAIPADFTVDGVGYIIKSTNEVWVHNRVDNALSTNLTIPSSVTHNGTTYNVTSIEYRAFEDCDVLTSVVIPNSVTSIGDNAFISCDNLSSVTIGENVTSIGSSAFKACLSLTSISIPNSVTTIGNNIFEACNHLETVNIGTGLTAISNHAFSECVLLETVTFNGSNLTSIGSWAFNNCKALESITLPNSVITINDRAFRSCEFLEAVVLPEGLETIGEEAFLDCIELTAITIPNSVKSIENGAFIRCVALPSITIPNNPHFTILNKEVFYGCRTITSVDIPNNVTHIDNRAFDSCANLNNVTIPEGVTRIGIAAFYNNNLTSVTIPSTVTLIDSLAFDHCPLTTVLSLADPAPAAPYYSFPGPGFFTEDDMTLTVPFNAQGYAYNWGIANWKEENANQYLYWKKIYHKINEGERDTLRNTFEITTANRREVINDGVLLIEQGGELVNETATNVGGIIEVKTKSLPNDKWSFIGAPFAGYKLETVVPGAHDISISEFDYEQGQWSSRWATILTEVGAGEGLFAWSFASEPTTFTTYGDVYNYGDNHNGFVSGNTNSYDFDVDPLYAINNGDEINVEKTVGANNNGNWMALANPYTFKLDIAKIKQQNTLQGGGVYKYNGTSFALVETGEIDVTEGFFVNFTSAGEHTATLNKDQRYIPTPAKASAEREYVRLAMLEGEREIELLFAQNEEANENYDIFDANKLFSPIEIAEPYFVVNNIALVKEEVKELPYYATMNVRSFGSKEVTFKANYIPEGLAVSIIDGEETIDLSEGVEYTTNIIAGENADRFKVLIKKSLSIEEAEELQVNIYNNNRYINIETMENDLQVEVYNALGQKVLSTKDRNFTLNQVSAGAYLIKAFNNKASKTQKIVVK